MIALDTNSIIYVLKGKGRVGERLSQTKTSDVFVPAIVAYELSVGTLQSAQPEKRLLDLERFLSAVEVKPFDIRCAQMATKIRVGLEASGKTIGPHDLLIAGTAMAHGATLITHNTDEFSRVPGLLWQDWF